LKKGGEHFVRETGESVDRDQSVKIPRENNIESLPVLVVKKHKESLDKDRALVRERV